MSLSIFLIDKKNKLLTIQTQEPFQNKYFIPILATVPKKTVLSVDGIYLIKI
jgi:hypothetical protein